MFSLNKKRKDKIQMMHRSRYRSPRCDYVGEQVRRLILTLVKSMPYINFFIIAAILFETQREQRGAHRTLQRE